ncbi:hypothetical protein B0H14DRAFT_2863952, partial [Mycena olivaceomarginata]
RGRGEREGQRAAAFDPPPFTPHRSQPDASATSAFSSLGPPFSPVHARHSPPPQSPFSPAWHRRTLRRMPTHCRRPPPRSPRPRAHRTRCTHALPVRTAPSAVARAVPGQPRQALILPPLTHMYKHLLSAPPPPYATHASRTRSPPRCRHRCNRSRR